MSKIKQLKEARSKVFTQIDDLRKATDGRLMTAEEQAKWNELRAAYDVADRAVDAEEQFLDMERRQAQQAEERRNPAEGDAAERYGKAFLSYLRGGEAGLSAEERAALAPRNEVRAGTVGLTLTGQGNGVIVPETLESYVETALKSYGGMFEAATVFSTATGADLAVPTINDTTSKATIISEYSSTPTTTYTFGSKVMKAYTYRTPLVPVSYELLQDSAFSLETIFGDLMSVSFSRGANEHLTTGTGSNQPQGIVTAATDADVAAAATSIKSDDLYDLIESVDSNYARNGRFMLNRKTLFALAKLKDNDGRYLWQQSLAGDLPATIAGYRYVLNDDMPDIGAGKASVLFGELSKYRIRMVRSFSILRLNEALAANLAVGFFGFARLDGALIDAGTHPVKKLVHAASASE